MYEYIFYAYIYRRKTYLVYIVLHNSLLPKYIALLVLFSTEFLISKENTAVLQQLSVDLPI